MKQGQVNSVFVEGGSVFVNINPANTHDTDLQRVPVARPAGAFTSVPAVGDEVLYTDVEGQGQVVTHVLTTSPVAFPALGEDSMSIRFGDVAELTVSESGGSYSVSIDGAAIELGDGGLGAVTDVTTTKDANGKVTDVTVTRSTKVNVE